MVDPDSQDAYWAAAVLRTEDMLDGIYKRLKASHGTRRFEPAIQFSFTPVSFSPHLCERE